MRAGVIIVLAVAAVLYGAPSPASAAGLGGAPMPSRGSSAGPSADSPSPQAGATIGPVAIAIGIGGIAVMALFAWLVPYARRRRGVEPPFWDTRGHAQRSRTTTDEQVTAALHRRTLRRARLRLEEDPIIASMGVGSSSRTERGVRRARRSARRSPPT